MEICFVPDKDYGKFLSVAGLAQKHRGEIINLQGQVLGHHDGIEFYTIGQRKGLGLSSPKPLYVIELDAARNRVIVGDDSAWIAPNSPCAIAIGFRSINRRTKCKLQPNSLQSSRHTRDRPTTVRRRSEGDTAHAATRHYSGTSLRFLRRRPGGGRRLDRLSEIVRDVHHLRARAGFFQAGADLQDASGIGRNDESAPVMRIFSVLRRCKRSAISGSVKL